MLVPKAGTTFSSTDPTAIQKLAFSHARTFSSGKNKPRLNVSAMPTSYTPLSLPLEVKQAILSSLQDIQSLRSVSLTGMTLYQALKSAESSIVSHVLMNELGADIFPMAIITAYARELGYEFKENLTPEAITQFLQSARKSLWDENRQVPILRLIDGLQMSNLHASVKYFTTDYLSKSLKRFESIGIILDSGNVSTLPSPPEVLRTRRAFYNFEMYCGLFSHSKTAVSFHEPLFFNQFSPWEMEQLACVHDHLKRAISPAFNEVASHDIVWGAMGVRSFLKSLHMQTYLSQGLVHLHQIAMANVKDYEWCHKLLCTVLPRRHENFLEVAFSATYGHVSSSFVTLSTLTPAEETRYFKPSVFPDSDHGPEDAWWWAHQHAFTNCFYNTPICASLREHAYVMWDRARLVDLKMLDKPWDARHFQPRMQDIPVNEWDQDSLKCSTEQRRLNIQRLGGRGWWSEEDERRVVWPAGRTPQYEKGPFGWRAILVGVPTEPGLGRCENIPFWSMATRH